MDKRRLKKAVVRLMNLPKNQYLYYYLSNKVNHFYLKITKSTKVAYPSNIMLELTNHCNLACTTCPREYDYGKDMDKGNMTVIQAKKIIDEVGHILILLDLQAWVKRLFTRILRKLLIISNKKIKVLLFQYLPMRCCQIS